MQPSEYRGPGKPIVLREVWDGRVWAALPAVVDHDEPDERRLFIPTGTTVKYATDADGRELRLYGDRWELREHVTTRPVLSFSWPEVPCAVLAMWDDGWRFSGWYVNLESPLRRTAIGFDFVDHCLDVLVPPGLEGWTWKDEDELAEAVGRGIFTAEQAAGFRREGERAATRILERRPPFDRDWSSWRPDQAWGIPELPDGWDLAGTASP